MAEHVFSLLCSHALIDKRTQQATVVEIIEKILIRPSPDFHETMAATAAGLAPGDAAGIPHRHWFVSWWVRSDYKQPESVACRVRVFMPNGQIAEDYATFVVDLETTTGFRITAQLPGVAWGGEGLYWVVVEQQGSANEWKQVARIPLELQLMETTHAAFRGDDSSSP